MAELEPIKGYNCMKTAILYISRAAFAKKIIYNYKLQLPSTPRPFNVFEQTFH